MTRRDFNLISTKFREHNAPLSLVLAMADALAHTNPKFDRRRFIALSGHRRYLHDHKGDHHETVFN